MSKFLVYISDSKETGSTVSFQSVQSALQESTPSEISMETFSHDRIQVAHSGKVSIHLDESRSLLFILSGYFRSPGFSSAYSDDATDLLPLFEGTKDPQKVDLEGCFSIAVCHLDSFDVWLMADRFGTKPLFYNVSQRHLAVSSEKYLLLPWVEKLTVPHEALTDSFWLGFSRAPESMIAGIAIVQDNGLVKIAKDGTTETFERPCPLVMDPQDDWNFFTTVSRIEAALDHEFAALSKTVDKAAVLLSGGVDSSIMAAYAKKHFAECVAFSCEIEGFGNPELEKAKYVAGKLGLKHHVVRLNLDDIEGVFSEVVSMLEGPSRHINNIVVRRIFQEIRGFDAIIGGDGADALFGKTSNKTIVNLENKLRLIGCIPYPLRPAIAKVVKGVRYGKKDQINNLLLKDIEWFISRLFTIEYNDQERLVAGKLDVSEFSELAMSGYKSGGVLGKSVEANFTLFLNSMLVRNGKLSNDSDIPIYYPFLSENMVEIARKLPYKLRFDDAGNAKPTLREIFRRLIDSSALEWPKIGFVTPEKPWLTNQLRSYLEDVLSNQGGIGKVLGLELDRDDIATVRSSPRLMWWLMTLDASLLEMEAKFLRWKQE